MTNCRYCVTFIFSPSFFPYYHYAICKDPCTFIYHLFADYLVYVRHFVTTIEKTKVKKKDVIFELSQFTA